MRRSLTVYTPIQSRGIGVAGLLMGVLAAGLPTQALAASSAPAKPPVASRPSAADVCVGLFHTCARTPVGEVACWGDNEDHQVATTDEPQIEAPRMVREFPTSTSLRCGASETCVQTRAGEIYCLGGPPSVEKLALPAPARDLVLDASGGCALLVNGRVMCWSRPERDLPAGTNAVPEAKHVRVLWEAVPLRGATAFARASALAQAVCVERAPAPLCLRELTRAENAAALPMSSALASASALLMPSYDATVLCGVLAKDRIGCDGQDVGKRGFPALAEAGARPGAQGGIVSVYGEGLCARDSAKVMRCLGEAQPLVTGIPKTADTAALGYDHGCAISDGTVRCWGAASRGQLGNAGTYLHTRPEKVPGLSDIAQLDASPLQACAVDHAGKVFCWGARPTYVAGFAFDFKPTEIKLAKPAREVRAATPGPVGTAQEQQVQPVCVRSTSGWSCLEKTWHRGRAVVASPLERLRGHAKNLSRDLQCGVNRQGRLLCAGGPDRAGNRTVKTKLLVFTPPHGTTFVEATSLFQVHGKDHVCGRTETGKVLCFDATGAPSASPVPSKTIEALTDIVQVEAAGTGADAAACALAKSGSVWCWGEGRWGQTGDVSRTHDPFTAVAMHGLPPVAHIAVGGSYVCAQLRSGEVYCWGSNRTGTAPNGQPGEHPEAKPVLLPATSSTGSR
jgi:alpha-tubulin suppressor-like RCC1 family protein